MYVCVHKQQVYSYVGTCFGMIFLSGKIRIFLNGISSISHSLFFTTVGIFRLLNLCLKKKQKEKEKGKGKKL